MNRYDKKNYLQTWQQPKILTNLLCRLIIQKFKREKTMAVVNDVVLIYFEDTPVSFARIESILPDTKKEWFHIKLLMLQIPLQVVTWILKQEYINGETFTMNDKKIRIEKVEPPVEDIALSQPANSDKKNVSPKKQDAKIISFPDKKQHE